MAPVSLWIYATTLTLRLPNEYNDKIPPTTPDTTFLVRIVVDNTHTV